MQLTQYQNAETILPENVLVNPNEQSLLTFLGNSLVVLWKDWPKPMHCSVLNTGENQFSLSGKCPHCLHEAVFMTVTSVYSETMPAFDGYGAYRLCAALQCQGCKKFILGIVYRT